MHLKIILNLYEEFYPMSCFCLRTTSILQITKTRPHRKLMGVITKTNKPINPESKNTD